MARMTPMEFFKQAGLVVVGTGGGNEALATPSYNDGTKPYVLITDRDGALPTSWDDVTVGAYGSDGECFWWVAGDAEDVTGS